MIRIADFIQLVTEKKAVMKQDPFGYMTFKYHNSVFYKNLWSLDPHLLECRGIVFDEHGAIVNRPFKKIFNLGENDTHLNDDDRYDLHRKVNGFMLAVSAHNGYIVVSTTGTTTSEYALLGDKWIRHYPRLYTFMWDMSEWTFIFECCDPSDPHIVEEKEGLHLLGLRNKTSGRLMPLHVVESIAREAGVMFPPVIYNLSKEDVLLITEDDTKEGWVVYPHKGNEPLMKVKSPTYLSRKALARLSKKRIQDIKDNPQGFRERLSEEFYGLFDEILERGVDVFFEMEEQERLEWIDNWFENQLQKGNTNVF